VVRSGCRGTLASHGGITPSEATRATYSTTAPLAREQSLAKTGTSDTLVPTAEEMQMNRISTVDGSARRTAAQFSATP